MEKLNWWQVGGYGIACVGYLVLGAVVFSAIESPLEAALVDTVRKRRAALLKASPCLAERNLERFVSTVVEASGYGVRAGRNASAQQLWSPSESYFFVVSALTSIGYGNAVPLSRLGMALCLFYVAIGIPVVFSLFNEIVDKLLDQSDHFYQSLPDRKPSRKVYSLVLAAIIFAFVILIPAAVFAYIEPEWGYLEALYYCVISATKIGLGDFVPGGSTNQKYRAIYKILTANFLLVSVLLTMFLFALIPEVLKKSEDFGYEEINTHEESSERKHNRQ